VNVNYVFILSALALTAVVVAVVVWSFLRSRPLQGQYQNQTQTQANAKIYQLQLADLEKEHAQGVISSSSFEQSRSELLGRMLEDTALGEDQADRKSPRTLASAVVLAVLLPVAAMSTYMWLGQPQGLERPMVANEPTDNYANLEAMAASLAQKLQVNPSNPEQWVMLGRTYRALSQFENALPAYQKALALELNDNIDLERVEVLALLRGGDFSGEPWAVIRQVLAKNPRHFNGLILAGSASYAQDDYKKAIQYWQKARSQLDDQSEVVAGLDLALNKAREKAGEQALTTRTPSPPTAQTSGAVLSGRVSIDPAVHAQIGPKDVVFVYATPTDGQKMPLAIVRKMADQLPFDFVLDDSTAMNAARPLSSETNVVLKVRVSKSGDATTRSGDWLGELKNVAVGSRNLKLVVNQQAP
jgi:cytochrome c-type biogenesis protein CcmH